MCLTLFTWFYATEWEVDVPSTSIFLADLTLQRLEWLVEKQQKLFGQRGRELPFFLLAPCWCCGGGSVSQGVPWDPAAEAKSGIHGRAGAPTESQ